MNTKEARTVPYGSSHGSGTAESLAKLYGILTNGGTHRGKQVLSQETIAALETPAMTGVDQMLGMKVQRGMGTWLMPVVEDDAYDKVIYEVNGFTFRGSNFKIFILQSTLIISKSKEPSETLRDIRTSTSQIWRIEENTNGTTKFHK